MWGSLAGFSFWVCRYWLADDENVAIGVFAYPIRGMAQHATPKSRMARVTQNNEMSIFRSLQT